MKLSCSKVGKVPIISQKNFFKKFFRAQKNLKTGSKKISYISGNGTFLYFLKKVFLIFWKTELFGNCFFKTSYTSRENLQSLKSKRRLLI